MKKAKILLPIAAIGATATAITPVLVSCGNGYLITGDEIYVPTVKPCDPGTLNRTVTNDTYFKHAKENSDVFVQDIRSDLSKRVYDMVHPSELENGTEDETLRKVKINYQMSNLSFDTFTAADAGNHTAGKVSYTLKGSILMDCRKSPLKVETKDTQEWYLSYLNLESIEVTMKNGAFYADVLNQAQYPHSWSIYFKSGTEFLGQINNWSVNIKVKGKYVGTQQFELFNYDNEYHYDATNPLPLHNVGTFAEEYLWSTYDKLFGTMAYSYHLQDVHVN